MNIKIFIILLVSKSAFLPTSYLKPGKKKHNFFVLFSVVLQLHLLTINGKLNSKNAVIEDITDVKEIKKIFRTKNNVLVLYASNVKETQNTIKILREAADLVKGQGTVVLVDCSNT